MLGAWFLETRLGLEEIFQKKFHDAGEQYLKDMDLRLYDSADFNEGLRHLNDSYFVTIVEWGLTSN